MTMQTKQKSLKDSNTVFLKDVVVKDIIIVTQDKMTKF